MSFLNGLKTKENGISVEQKVARRIALQPEREAMRQQKRADNAARIAALVIRVREGVVSGVEKFKNANDAGGASLRRGADVMTAKVVAGATSIYDSTITRADKLLDNTVDRATQAGEAAMATGKSFVAKAADVSQRAYENTINAKDAVVYSIQTNWERVLDTGDRIENSVVETLNDTLDSAMQFGGEVRDRAGLAMNALGSRMRDAWNRTRDGALGIAEGALNTVSGTAENVSSGAQALNNRVVSMRSTQNAVSDAFDNNLNTNNNE